MSKIRDAQHSKVEIAVENFGPIAKADIDLRPLTVFVGPSNTGKTYFATLVYALQGAFNDLSGSGLLSLFEPQKILGFLRQLLTDLDIPKEERRDLLKKLEIIDRPFRLSDLPKGVRERLKTIIKSKDFWANELQDELKNCFDLNSILELSRLTGEQRNEMTILMKVSEGAQERWDIKIEASDPRISLDISTNDDSILIPRGWAVSGESVVFGDGSGISFTRSWIVGSRYYLPAARSGIMQSHRILATSLVTRATRVGLERLPEIPTLSGVIAEFMQQIILYDEDRALESQLKHLYNEEGMSVNQVKHLANALELEVLAGQVRMKPSASGYPDFRYLPQGTDEEIRLSQSSSMVSELAPLVLYLRSLVQPGDTLIIEEPEAHLHPGAQADMAVILARLVRAGVKVIITTHSDWLLQEIGNLIRVGELEKTGEVVSELPTSLQKEHVGVWHFQKDGKVEEIPYNRIDGVEPMEYLDVAEDLYNRSARLQNRLEETKGASTRE